MTFKEIYDDLMAGVLFKREHKFLGTTYLIVVTFGDERALCAKYKTGTYSHLNIDDLTATDWERA